MTRRPPVKIAGFLAGREPDKLRELIDASVVTSAPAVAATVYVMAALTSDGSDSIYKIGLSTQPDIRARQLKKRFGGMTWEILHQIPCSVTAETLEAALHSLFAGRRVYSELSRELFDLRDDELAYLYSLTAVDGLKLNITLLDYYFAHYKGL